VPGPTGPPHPETVRPARPTRPRPHPLPRPSVADRNAALRLAVTGTDTGVGKTLVTCALVAALRARALTVAAMKPVETGITERHAGTDAERLRRTAGSVHAAADVCPVTYAEPLAPLVAAERAGRPVDWAVVEAARGRLEAGVEAFVVEGAGGLLVPFAFVPPGRQDDVAHLAERGAPLAKLLGA